MPTSRGAMVLYVLAAAGTCICRAEGDEPAAVQHAFDDINKQLASVHQYEAGLTAQSVDSIDGTLVTTGRVVQQPPFAFRREVGVEEIHGTARRHETTVCDGTTGWHVVAAPGGAIVNASRWGSNAVEDMFYVMLPKARAFMLSPDRTSTYTGVRQAILFDTCTHRTGLVLFAGRYRTRTPQYDEMSRVAYAFGPVGMSNFLVGSVELKVNDQGIPVEFVRNNLRGQPVQRITLTDVRVNQPLAAGTFSYAPPPGTFVFDADRAREYEPVQVAHPLLGKQAPSMTLKTLSGKDTMIAPGTAPVVLTFFTSWSTNCRKYLPVIEKLYQAYASRGVIFVCITDETATDTVRKLCKTEQLTLPVYLDTAHRVTGDYSIQMVPKTLVISRTGMVTDAFEGNTPGIDQALDAAIRSCLGQK